MLTPWCYFYLKKKLHCTALNSYYRWIIELINFNSNLFYTDEIRREHIQRYIGDKLQITLTTIPTCATESRPVPRRISKRNLKNYKTLSNAQSTVDFYVCLKYYHFINGFIFLIIHKNARDGGDGRRAVTRVFGGRIVFKYVLLFSGFRGFVGGYNGARARSHYAGDGCFFCRL